MTTEESCKLCTKSAAYFVALFVQTYKIKNRYRKTIDKTKNMVYNNKCKVKKRYKT